MPVRLNKALKELNIGINTAAEFLQKKGKILEDVSINYKLTDEQYELLVSAFGADKSKHEEIKLVNQKRKEKEQKERDERREQQQKEKEEKEKKKAQSEEPFRTPSERKQSLKIIGNINDIQAKKTAEKTKEEVKEEPQAPVEKPQPVAEPAPVETPKAETPEQPTEQPAEQPEAPKAEPKKTAKKQEVAGTTDEDGVFRMEPRDPGLQLKQVGYIDLSSINSKTRPDKKSKAERKKEREEKERQRKQGAADANAAQGAEAGKKKKRARISGQRVDINAVANQIQPDNGKKKKGQGGQNAGAGQNMQGGGKKKKKNSPLKQPELTDEEISKQVKETLARLTSKQMKKGVKYRKDKREAIHQRME